MAVGTTSTKIIDNQTIAASGNAPSTGVNLDAAIGFAVGYQLTFNAAATKGARLEMYADPAGLSSDFTIGTDANLVDVADIDIEHKAGKTVEGVVQFNHVPNYAKIKLVNLDTAETITAASVWSQVKTA